MKKTLTISAGVILGLVGAFSLNSLSQVSTGVEGPGTIGGGGGGLEVACVPDGDEFDLLLDDGASGCSPLGAGMADQVLTSAGAGMSPTWEDAAASGVTQTTGTFEITWPNACTTTPSQTWNYVLTGMFVSLQMVDDVTCTSDSISFTGGAGQIPASLRPARDQTFVAVARVDDGANNNEEGCISITTSGQMFVTRFTAPNCGGVFLNTGTKGMHVSDASDGGQNALNYALN